MLPPKTRTNAKARAQPSRSRNHPRPASSARRLPRRTNLARGSRAQVPIFLFFGFGVAAAAVAAPAVTSLVACGLLPSLVIFALDWSEGQNTACTVGSMNVAGVIPFMPALLSRGSNAISPANLLGDTTALIVMYAAAAAGWLLIALLPSLFAFFEHEETRQRRETLRRVQARLEEEWGQEVRGPSFEPPAPQTPLSFTPSGK